MVLNVAPQTQTVSVPVTAQTLGVCNTNVYDACARGEIPCIRVGRRIRIPLSWLNQKLFEFEKAGANAA